MYDEDTNPAGEFGELCVCGLRAVCVDPAGTPLCATCNVVALGLDRSANFVTWDITPAGEAALEGIIVCPTCGAFAGEPAARATCLWTLHGSAA